MAGFASYTLSGARWPSTTITYSLAASTAATSPGGPFSALLTTPSYSGYGGGGDPAYALGGNVQFAFNEWLQATGITLQEVPDSTSPSSLPDIRVGFANLGSSTLSAFSATSVDDTFQPGAELLLQDTKATPLTSSGVYQGTQASFLNVVESAIGHALGVAAASGPSTPLASNTTATVTSDGSTSPAFINAASVAGVEALYGSALPQSGIQSQNLGSVDTDPNNSLSAARYGILGGTAGARIPTSALVSLTADGTLQLQANEPGAAAIALPGVRVIGPSYNGDTIPYGLSDPTGNAQAVARLYQAVLDRSPDLGGLYGYAHQVDQGTLSLAQVASFLVSSPEFLAKYPAASGTSASAQAMFVDQLYENLFGRPADAGGGYVAAIQGGESEGQIALDISRSLEARNDYLPYEGDRSLGTLYRLYEAAFGRAPDAADQALYVPQLDQGISAQSIAASILASPEFAATPGASSDTAFVSQVYQGVLGRAPDAGGLAGYTAALAGGLSRARVLADISSSSEARAHTALATHDGWVYLPHAVA